MPVFPDNRYDNVTNNPEGQFTGPLKGVFPGSRPGTVTVDPLREGDAAARKGHFPSSYPASGVTADPLRDADSAQTNNANTGGERGESGVNGPLHQGATDPEHDTSGDGVGRNKPTAPTSPVATGGAGQVSVAFVPGSIPGTSYTVVVTPGGKKNTGTSSPIVVTGVASGTAVTAKVNGTNELGDGPQSVASNSVTPS